MKFTCNKGELIEAVAVVQRAAAVKGSISALEGILVETKNDRVTFTAYDLDIGVVYHIDASVDVEGSIVLPCKLFGDIVRKLPEDTVRLTTDEKFLTNIASGSAKYTILGLSAMEYPELPTIIAGDELDIKCGPLHNLLRQTVFAAAETDDRPILQGILFDITPETKDISAVAVDGVRLAIRKEKILDFEGKNIQFVIPRKTVLEILKVLPEDDDFTVKISISHKHFIFDLGDKKIISRRLEGEFLNYKNAIPETCAFSLIVDKKQFASTIERAALMVSPTARIPIHCTFDYNMIKISSATNMGKFYDEFEISPFHQTLEVGFNHRYMLDALAACDEEIIKLELNNSKTPIVIKSPDHDDFIFLVLPMRLTNDD